MKLGRREFIKLSATATAVTAFAGLGISLQPTTAKAQLLNIHWAKETTSICCYCSVGCGVLVHTDKSSTGRCINIEGDPDHPINEGALCAKGAALYQVAENENRMTKVLYRAPYTDKFVEAPWGWALQRIAEKVKEARDETFVQQNANGQVVNRTDGIAHVGSAEIENEENWYLQAMQRAMGLVYIEHQARI